MLREITQNLPHNAMHRAAGSSEEYHSDENENELYWPGMFTHTRNLL